ncbi:MAG: carboxylate-amine ligase [Gammaproteobacteria bacterium]|nr:carboxylate-amine ligase [Gammaproteobacteria bacterium]MCP4088855.1 carboxylate-amine ligase [Gammaproteobacteria bacterium]MCP4274871.1 carboxylate-amine ligase [Gammaproteobacteria bacterium]MCP4832062.1 carboxylate-amine ligase [Gammaproteobacteria bacterium]MCP4928337.1 carboxylate-amine ligase [Gammaproteobacteria bacterium]
MTNVEPQFTLGIEEEYLLVDTQTMELSVDPPAAIIEECARQSGGQVTPELLRSQIEVGTKVCADIHEAREDLTRLRQIVVNVSREYGYAPIAASTHPFGHWTKQQPTTRDRYSHLAMEMQAAGRRLLTCGMHVHVGISDDELRNDLMSQARYFLPHLLALSTSSPFWEGQDTGLRSYRLTVFDALPRSGLPEEFDSFAEYQRHVDKLVSAGIIEDSTMVWWDMRPSGRYPTLETRIFDVCTSIDDAVALAALNVCVLRTLYRLRLQNQRWRIYNRMLINENRWRAMRYGLDEGLLDLVKGELVPFAELLQEIIELISEDAAALGCEQEIAHLFTIMKRGTSAHRQVAVMEAALGDGATQEDALRSVVHFLVDETAGGAKSAQ